VSWCLQLDSNAQLENISKLKVYSYKFTDEYADYAGLPAGARHDTGVLAQDVKDVLPDAVTQSHNVTLPTGDVIHDFLVVNKVRRLIVILTFFKFSPVTNDSFRRQLKTHCSESHIITVL